MLAGACAAAAGSPEAAAAAAVGQAQLVSAMQNCALMDQAAILSGYKEGILSGYKEGLATAGSLQVGIKRNVN